MFSDKIKFKKRVVVKFLDHKLFNKRWIILFVGPFLVFVKFFRFVKITFTH